MKNHLHRWLFLGLSVLLLSGCTSTSSAIRIFTNDFPQVSHRTGIQKVRGDDCGSGSIMGIKITKGPSIIDAIREAISSAGPGYNALMDVQVTEQMHTNLVIAYHCLMVEGLPVNMGKVATPKNYVPVGSEHPASIGEEQWNF